MAASRRKSPRRSPSPTTARPSPSADGNLLDRRARQRAARRRAVRRIPAGPLDRTSAAGRWAHRPIARPTGARDFNDGFIFRRTRFGIEGTIARDFNYKLLIELGGSATEGPKINDAVIGYTGLAPFTFQLGAFAPARQHGRQHLGRGPAVPGALRGFGTGALAGRRRRPHRAWSEGQRHTLDELRSRSRRAPSTTPRCSTRNLPPSRAPDSSSPPAPTTTCTWARRVPTCSSSPIRDLALRRVIQCACANGPRCASTARASSTRAPSMPNMPASMALEFGANWKNFYVQGEHFWYDIERRASALDDPDFAGYYLQGSWIFTGERRRYNPASGAFQSPRAATPFSSEGGLGACELAARYSRMDLNFREGIEGTAAAPGAVRGGDQEVITLGVNWFPNPNVKVMLELPDDRRGALQSRRPGQRRSPSAPHRTRRPSAWRSARISTSSRCERSSVSSAIPRVVRCPAGATPARAGTRG